MLAGVLSCLGSAARHALKRPEGSARACDCRGTPPGAHLAKLTAPLRRLGTVTAVNNAGFRTLDEAAEIIGISRSAVEWLADEGVLPSAVTRDCKRLFPAADLNAFAASRRRMQDGLNAAATEAQATGLFTRRRKAC